MHPRCPNIETHWVRFGYKGDAVTIRGAGNYIRIIFPVDTISKLCAGKLKGRTINGVIRIKVATVQVPTQFCTIFF